MWFGDGFHAGQKNKITRRWAKRGTRLSAPQDQRTASAYIFGAVYPQTGEAAGLVLPWCNTKATKLHLAETSARITAGKHCALRVNQAGSRFSERPAIPSNITIVPLPAKCHELNPAENLRQLMRDNGLSWRVFNPCDAIVDHCCYAWNKLADQP